MNQSRRRWIEKIMILCAGTACRMPVTWATAQSPWALWERYAQDALSADGRVVEHAREGRTTSEGQAYALFFSLVADDRSRFDDILSWILNHLWIDRAQPPAWLWGQRQDSSWGIIDDNSASDADLWIGYALLEAARLWERPAYLALGAQMLDAVQFSEVAKLSDGSFLLIPGKGGFRLADRTYLLNPSYAPLQLLRRFASHQLEGPWQSIATNQVKLLMRSAPAGFVPDWYKFQDGAGFSVESTKGPTGSYDAIRTYLWAGMLNRADPSRTQILSSLSGMSKTYLASSQVPHYVNVKTGEVFGQGPPGFSAAIYPLLVSAGETQLAARLLAQIESDVARRWPSLTYYDRNLILFSIGWARRLYEFDADGFLQRMSRHSTPPEAP